MIQSDPVSDGGRPAEPKRPAHGVSRGNSSAGKSGSVGVATASNVDFGTGAVGSQGVTTLMAFGKWRVPMEAGTPEISNFLTAPFRAFVPGLIGATVECDCPGYNQGNMPLTCGNPYVVTLGWTNTLNIVVTAILKKLEPDNDVAGAPSIKATWQVTGQFVPSVT